MGKERGRPKRGRLADMTVAPPADPVYEVPPPSECEEIEGFEILSMNHELRTRFVLWRDRYMVEFAIMYYYRTTIGWEQVSRIDTDHSKIHRHQLRRGGDDQGTVHPILDIPADNGWETIDKWYDESLTLMRREWPEYLRQGGWRND